MSKWIKTWFNNYRGQEVHLSHLYPAGLRQELGPLKQE